MLHRVWCKFSHISYFSISVVSTLQTLRENIHQEYREVVERRVFTGVNALFRNRSFAICVPAFLNSIN